MWCLTGLPQTDGRGPGLAAETRPFTVQITRWPPAESVPAHAGYGRQAIE